MANRYYNESVWPEKIAKCLEKWLILTPVQKFLKNVRDLDKLSVAKSILKLAKVHLIARSGHTGPPIGVLYFLLKSSTSKNHEKPVGNNRQWRFDRRHRKEQWTEQQGLMRL